MRLVLISLGAGLLCGLVPGAQRLRKANRVLSIGGLFALLVMMGVNIGGDRTIYASLPTIGWSAVVLATLAVAGSVLFTLPLIPRVSPQGERYNSCRVVPNPLTEEVAAE